MRYICIEKHTGKMAIVIHEGRPSMQKQPRGNGMGISSRYFSPPPCHESPDHMLKYEYAEKLAQDIEIKKGSRHFVIVNGTFIFGDFIEALIVKHNWHIKGMTVSTLSYNQNNIDSLKNLMEGDFVDNLNLIVSDYFFAHERSRLIKYAYEKLDIGDRFQFAAAGTHCKITSIETHDGLKIVMHGSANLRSSDSIEHVQIEEGGMFYDFNQGVFSKIIEKYKTINKKVPRAQVWESIK